MNEIIKNKTMPIILHSLYPFFILYKVLCKNIILSFYTHNNMIDNTIYNNLPKLISLFNQIIQIYIFIYKNESLFPLITASRVNGWTDFSDSFLLYLLLSVEGSNVRNH